MPGSKPVLRVGLKVSPELSDATGFTHVGVAKSDPLFVNLIILIGQLSHWGLVMSENRHDTLRYIDVHMPAFTSTHCVQLTSNSMSCTVDTVTSLM